MIKIWALGFRAPTPPTICEAVLDSKYPNLMQKSAITNGIPSLGNRNVACLPCNWRCAFTVFTHGAF
eukprot:6361758-Pyramimonas_sp.AAC.1